jgi:TM2 domain-containing membrane protein YozV
MNCAVHNQSQAVAYCRTCGKALCEECKRDVMGAIYCEPCIAARLQAQPGVAAAAAPPPPVAQQMPAVVPGTPSPVLAALLGFIPGVGAMYNGQFVKAFAHVVIFTLLILATVNVHWIFGWLIGFFVFYMVFEAYKTAEAKRLGLPAPDPLGLDRMFGIQDSQPTHAAHIAPPGNLAVAQPVAPVNPVQVAPPPPPAQDNTPVGAVVLLVLGFVFLLSNFGLLHVGRLWPLILIGFGLWIAYKRTSQQSY